ncbi:hypothetical protein Misp03_86870 [Microbispora sp. NBRC 16548]|nr:hypothetical protein Misp03_86870 [Microbispora sp. NBRC 16548]
MGYSFKRLDRNGKPRYTACYQDLKGNILSAGTFSDVHRLSWSPFG